MKAVIILLVLACAGLGVGLWKMNQRMVEERLAKEEKLQEVAKLETTLETTQVELEEQKQVSEKLNEDLTTSTTKLQETSNKVENLQASLTAALVEADAEAEKARSEIAEKQEEIQKLEGQNANLNNKMTDLTGAIDELERQIADTERQLADSEGDREFLLAELKRLQSEKIELERQFNDLALLRDQIRKLKDELSIASRLEWIRRGLYGSTPEGAEKLQPGFAPPTGDEAVDLDVEIRQGEGARVLSDTNAVPTTP